MKEQWKNFCIKVGLASSEQVRVAEERRILVSELSMAKYQWDIAAQNFEFMKNQDNVDEYIYHMKAAEMRFESILKQIRDLDGIENHANKNTRKMAISG